MFTLAIVISFQPVHLAGALAVHVIKLQMRALLIKFLLLLAG